jgi:hypothetical protein
MRGVACTFFLLAAGLAASPAAAQAQQNWSTVDVVYVPTPYDVVAEMLRLAGVGKGDVLYDLGSGDGRIPIAATKKFGIRATVIDIDAELVRQAEDNARNAGVSGAGRSSARKTCSRRISGTRTVVTLYLQPHLRPEAASQAVGRAQARHVVSHQFDMGDWPPEKKLERNGRTLYFWTIPPR